MKFISLLLIMSLVSPAFAEGLCDNEAQAFIKKFGEVKNAANFNKARNELLNDIEWWQKLRGQAESRAQFERDRLEYFLEFSLYNDRPEIIISHTEAMTNDVQLAYHIIKKNRALEEEFAYLIGKDPLNPDLLAMKGQMEEAIAENLKQAKVIAKHMNKYSTAVKTYDAIIAKEKELLDKGLEVPAELARAAKNAKFVKYKMQSQYILDNFFLEAKIPKELQGTPSLPQVYQVLDEFTEADLYRLKLDKRKEKWNAILSVSPTDTFFNYLDKALDKVPWVDKSKFRAVIYELRDFKRYAQHYSGIQHVIMSEASASKKLEMLIGENISSKDDMLVTFSRRVDARKQWNELKETAQTENPEFFARMEKAEAKGKKMTELSILKDDRYGKLAFAIFDFALGSAGIYFGTKYVNKVLKKNDPEQKDDGPDKFTKAEEKELEDGADAAADAIKNMKKDGVEVKTDE